MPALLPIFKKAYWTLAALGGTYAAFLVLLTNPYIQRHALYAYKIHSGRWDNALDRPASLGFGQNQVHAFNLPTPDGEELFGWHMLPLTLYARHEAELESAAKTNTSAALALKLLTDDPESRVVINFHGNAGHIAQGHRPLTYRSLTSSHPRIHIFTIDYRGFGLSTGFPTETGLITDGIALVNHVLSLGIPSSRIVIIGQSLGTAVASAVGLHFASPSAAPELLPPKEDGTAFVAERDHHSPSLGEEGEGVDFAAIILVASFQSLPKLLLTYRIGGLIPILSPLRPYHRLREYLLSTLKDKWNTSARLNALTTVVSTPGRNLRLHILHARNDWEIPWKSSEENFRAADEGLIAYSAEGEGKNKSFGGFVEGTGVKFVELGAGRVKLILEVLRWGGHNQIVADVPVAIAVLKAFGLVEDTNYYH